MSKNVLIIENDKNDFNSFKIIVEQAGYNLLMPNFEDVKILMNLYITYKINHQINKIENSHYNDFYDFLKSKINIELQFITILDVCFQDNKEDRYGVDYYNELIKDSNKVIFSSELSANDVFGGDIRPLFIEKTEYDTESDERKRFTEKIVNEIKSRLYGSFKIIESINNFSNTEIRFPKLKSNE